MPRTPALLLSALALTLLLPGCVQSGPQAVRECEEGRFPDGTLEITTPGNEAPGGNFSVKLVAVNGGNCEIELEQQNVTIAFRDQDGNVASRNVTELYPADRFLVGPGNITIGALQTGNLGDFRLVAPMKPGRYTIEASLERPAWSGEAEIDVNTRGNSTTQQGGRLSYLPAF